MKKAKIIATLGPAVNNKDAITKLAEAGVDVFRLNFSFGAYAEHKKTIGLIREVSNNLDKSIAILQDLQGPKIRVGKLQHPVTVKKGMEIILSGNSIHKEDTYIPTTYKEIASDTSQGKTILLADGKIILSVIDANVRKKEVLCKVINGGTILTGKGINLPYTDISLPALTKKDREDALFGLENGVDFIGLSFVRHAQDVLKLKNLMRRKRIYVPIIAKIEKPEGVENIDLILDVADGIMVARGDLAVEISFAKVPIVQKELIKKANTKGKLTIVATEMLSSMINNPAPTRAEASDVANAILDGTDAVMLSNETAMGKFPVQAVKAMKNIIEQTEKTLMTEQEHLSFDMPEIHARTEAICATAADLSYFLDERALGVITHTGNSVNILSKYRPQSVIYAATFDERIYRRMALFHNVLPVLLKEDELDENSDIKHASLKQFGTKLKQKKFVKKGNIVILITGDIDKKKGWTANTIKVHEIS